MSDNLTGSFHVRSTYGAFADADRLFSKTRDAIELRRHALKLRYWPANNPVDHNNQLVDLDWSWIRSMPNSGVGELRIHDTIGGHDNLRLIFYLGPPCDRTPKRCIWIIAVLQKRRNDFTSYNITTFNARRRIVVERFYEQADWD